MGLSSYDIVNMFVNCTGPGLVRRLCQTDITLYNENLVIISEEKLVFLNAVLEGKDII
jgi:hypothetical protein